MHKGFSTVAKTLELLWNMKPIRLEKLLNFCQTNLLRLTNIIAYKQNMKQPLIGLNFFTREIAWLIPFFNNVWIFYRIQTWVRGDLCLVLLQVPKCFGLVQIFCARPKIYLHIVAVTNILCQTKRWFAFSKIGFCAGTKVFEEALNAVKFLGWLKKFGLAQNILRPVKGQGISSHYCPLLLYTVGVIQGINCFIFCTKSTFQGRLYKFTP